MKLVRFDAGKGPRPGVLTDQGPVDLLEGSRRLGRELGVSPENASAWFGSGMQGIISAGDPAVEAAARISSRMDPEKRAFRLLSPLKTTGKIIAVGLNYMDHCREQKIDPPNTPVLFSKAPSSMIGPGDPIIWPDGLTNQVDPEVELGVVIGRKTKGVAEDNSMESIFGYTIINDVSARDIQFGDKQWVRGKSLDTFCPVGPCLITRDQIPDPQALALECRVNGKIWQNSNTREMIFPVKALISFVARGITLLPGDLLATGTPHGVGVFQNPPVFLAKGDKIRLEIEKIGILENPVAGPS